MPEQTRHEVLRVGTQLTIKVVGAPDTRGAGGPRVTVRPEQIRVRLDGDLNDPIEYVGVWGRTVRQDGEITGYREVGWSYLSWSPGPRPPAWIADILDKEGLVWPSGWQL